MLLGPDCSEDHSCQTAGFVEEAFDDENLHVHSTLVLSFYFSPRTLSAGSEIGLEVKSFSSLSDLNSKWGQQNE